MARQMRLKVGLDRPKPFSLVFVTADRRRNTGGEFREFHWAVLASRRRTEDRTILIQVRGLKRPIRVALDLIIYFNGQPVS